MNTLKTIARYTSDLLNRPIIRNITPAAWFLKVRFYFYMEEKLNLVPP